MDDSLYFSEQHLATREMVRQFARDEVAPIAAKYDASAKFPWESIRKMGELGRLAYRGRKSWAAPGSTS
jgi:alkylation response protein AidB-like acyl-CoA dehydrogenase